MGSEHNSMHRQSIPPDGGSGAHGGTPLQFKRYVILKYISPSWPLDPLGALVPEGSQEGGVRGGID